LFYRTSAQDQTLLNFEKSYTIAILLCIFADANQNQQSNIFAALLFIVLVKNEKKKLLDPGSNFSKNIFNVNINQSSIFLRFGFMLVAD
jgi:hypothetical protein